METLKTFLKDQGWTLVVRNRRTSGRQYLYAAQMRSNPRRTREKYIGPASRLAEMTEATVKGKLEKEGDTAHK